MSRRTIAAALLAAALALPGCAQRPPQQPPQDLVGVDSPIVSLTAEEEKLVDDLYKANSHSPGEPRDFEKAKLKTTAQAREAFPETLVPAETFGRRLVGIIHEKARDGAAIDPIDGVILVYEEGLLVSEHRYLSQPLDPNGEWRRGGIVKPGVQQEATSVAGLDVTVWTTKAQGEVPAGALIRWSVDDGHVVYIVNGPKLTKEEVVAVARSLK